MLLGSLRVESTTCLKILNDLFVSVLDINALVIRDCISEAAILVHGYRCLSWIDEFLLDTCLEIVFTKAWSTMNDTSTSTCSYEFCSNNCKATFWPVFLLKEREKWFVFCSY